MDTHEHMGQLHKIKILDPRLRNQRYNRYGTEFQKSKASEIRIYGINHIYTYIYTYIYIKDKSNIHLSCTGAVLWPCSNHVNVF